jgi:hypothetical protein
MITLRDSRIEYTLKSLLISQTNIRRPIERGPSAARRLCSITFSLKPRDGRGHNGPSPSGSPEDYDLFAEFNFDGDESTGMAALLEPLLMAIQEADEAATALKRNTLKVPGLLRALRKRILRQPPKRVRRGKPGKAASRKSRGFEILTAPAVFRQDKG